MVAPLVMACDALLIIVANLIGSLVYYSLAYQPESLWETNDILRICAVAAVVAAFFIAWGNGYGVYKLSELLNLKTQISKIAVIWAAVFLFLAAMAFVLKVGDHFSRATALILAGSGLAALVVTRAVWRILLSDALSVRRFSNRKVAVIAEQASADDAEFINSLKRHGLEPTYRFFLPAYHGDEGRRKNIIAQFVSSVRGSDIEEVVVGARLDHWPELSRLLTDLRVLPMPVNLIPVGPLSELFKLSSHTIGETVTIELQRGPRTLLELAAKRAIDIVIAATALVMFMPLFVVTAITIRLESPGPVLFRQWRHGFNGRPFRILKFRSMSVQEDGDHVVQAKQNDRRVTRFGNWLRRTSIDELPQLINVLQGTMSIVGPRPHAMAHDNEFDKLVSKYAYRQRVKPGLTGWAQVNGFRGETRTVADIEQRIKFDLWYIDNWSLRVDLRILFMTVTEILFGENAY
jgi:putative colanic acid biosynthesis UDP-glucose lipid carrier transferase